ncbi:hypothetical protein ACC806_37470, partial [Rhizobium ruizarguesonis]
VIRCQSFGPSGDTSTLLPPESGPTLTYPANECLPFPVLQCTIFAANRTWPVRICIYKSDEAPEVTLFLREGVPVPAHPKGQKWRHVKAGVGEEVRADRLTQIEIGNGCLFVNLGASPKH